MNESCIILLHLVQPQHSDKLFSLRNALRLCSPISGSFPARRTPQPYATQPHRASHSLRRSAKTSKGEPSMVDSTIQRLLEKAIDSPIKLQICLLFDENQRLMGSAAELANRIYRDI